MSLARRHIEVMRAVAQGDAEVIRFSRGNIEVLRICRRCGGAGLVPLVGGWMGVERCGTCAGNGTRDKALPAPSDTIRVEGTEVT